MRRGSRVAAPRRRLVAGAAIASAMALPAAAQAADRGFELVSPAGADPTTVRFVSADPDGERVHFGVWGPNGPDPLPIPSDGGQADYFSVTRSSGGWGGLEWLNPVCPGDGNVNDGATCSANTPDDALRWAVGGRVFLVGERSYTPADGTTGPSGNDVYVSDADNGAALLSGGPSGTVYEGVSVAASTFVSRDGSTILYPYGQLLGTDLDADQDVYVSRDGVVSHATPGPECFGCLPFNPEPRPWQNPVSDDGDRVFFGTDRDVNAEEGDTLADVYVNEPGGTTLLSPGTSAAALFASATPDGATAFWTTTEAILPAEDADAAQDLYATDIDTGTISLVSSGGTTDDGAGFVAAAPDGSTVFFATAEQIAGSGAPANADPKIYAASGGTVTFVATLPGGDPLVDFDAFRPGGGGPVAVADNGSSMVFSTSASLLPTDGNGVQDIYRWTPGSGLELLTPRPVGEDGADARFLAMRNANGTEAVDQNLRWGPGITADGSAVYFDTPAALVPEDTDGGRSDVYGWTAADGLELISPGGSENADSFYRSNTANGSDVYFESGEAITGWDADQGEFDIYDARIGGGFPEPAPSGGGVGSSAAGGGAASTPQPPSPPTTVTGPVDPVTVQPADDQVRPGSGAGKVELADDSLEPGRRAVIAEVSVPGAGVLRAKLKIETKGGHSKTAARGTKRFTAAGSGKVRLRLNGVGRRALRSGEVHGVLVTRFTAADGSVSRSLAKVTVQGAAQHA